MSPKKSSSRRIGAEDSKSRIALLDAAEALMLEHGYPAVTSRKVAAAAGLKPQLVHYYFRTMDDLLLAMFRRRAEQGLKRQAEALASDDPLAALWALNNERSGTALAIEFSALAQHRPAIRDEVARYAEEFRVRQVGALRDAMVERSIDPEEFPPLAVSVLMTSLSRMLLIEEGIGMSAGHNEVRELVEGWLTAIGTPSSG